MTVTEFKGKLFVLGTTVAGAYFGGNSYGTKGAFAGIVAGYIGGLIIFNGAVYFTILRNDIKNKKSKV